MKIADDYEGRKYIKARFCTNYLIGFCTAAILRGNFNYIF
jgi:hypothetical protein